MVISSTSDNLLKTFMALGFRAVERPSRPWVDRLESRSHIGRSHPRWSHIRGTHIRWSRVATEFLNGLPIRMATILKHCGTRLRPLAATRRMPVPQGLAMPVQGLYHRGEVAGQVVGSLGRTTSLRAFPSVRC